MLLYARSKYNSYKQHWAKSGLSRPVARGVRGVRSNPPFRGCERAPSQSVKNIMSFVRIQVRDNTGERGEVSIYESEFKRDCHYGKVTPFYTN